MTHEETYDQKSSGNQAWLPYKWSFSWENHCVTVNYRVAAVVNRLLYVGLATYTWITWAGQTYLPFVG